MKAIADMGMGELAAFVCSHLQRRGIDVVLTGGGCVCIYAAGKYVSDDLDFIENLSSGRRKLKAALAEIDFQEQGRYFRHPETRIFLEFPAGPLAVGDEPPQSLKVLSYETGTLVALSPTDQGSISGLLPLERSGVSGTSATCRQIQRHRSGRN